MSNQIILHVRGARSESVRTSLKLASPSPEISEAVVQALGEDFDVMFDWGPHREWFTSGEIRFHIKVFTGYILMLVKCSTLCATDIGDRIEWCLEGRGLLA